MEKHDEAKMLALKNIRTADHMFTVTYPMIKDPKLLLAVLENVFLAYSNAMGAILFYERYNKKIFPFQNNFESKFYAFQENIFPKYNFDVKHIKSMNEIKEIIVEHKNSKMEFRRSNNFVICNDEYGVKTITEAKIKEYIYNAKEFIHLINGMVERK